MTLINIPAGYVEPIRGTLVEQRDWAELDDDYSDPSYLPFISAYLEKLPGGRRDCRLDLSPGELEWLRVTVNSDADRSGAPMLQTATPAQRAEARDRYVAASAVAHELDVARVAY